MRLNVRTAKIITLTAVFGGVAIYDYTYVSNLHTDQRRTEDKGLFEDIEINDEISSYLAQPTAGVPRPEAQASTTAGEGAGYVPALEEILAGEITPAEHVKPQSDRHINLGFILINLQPGSSQLSKKFSNQTLSSVLRFWSSSPLNVIVVTDRASVGSVATFLGRLVMRETAQRVLATRAFKWRRVKDVPRVKVNYVDYTEILEKNKPFSKRLIAVQAQSKENKTVSDDKYLAELFYIAPIYHLGFPALDKLLVIDGTDLEFHDDIKLLYDQFKYVTNGKIIGLGLDLSPNYYNQLNTYRIFNSEDPFGLPGESQGFNTGVVLYNLEAMRRSTLYNKYLSPVMVDMLAKKFMYDFTLAEQDWFTNLSFLHPDLFYVLPCKFNRQTSIQYLQPPWENMFESFHDCDPKLDVMVYHTNGCGPQPEACGVLPHSANYTGTYWKNRTRYWKDIHVDFDNFWQALAGLDY